MAEHHDVFDAQRPDRIFERRRNAVRAAVGRIDGHQIGDVANHEQFARAGIEDHLRRNPESQQPITITSGAWPRSDNSR